MSVKDDIAALREIAIYGNTAVGMATLSRVIDCIEECEKALRKLTAEKVDPFDHLEAREMLEKWWGDE